jgi:hypothetical protein
MRDFKTDFKQSEKQSFSGSCEKCGGRGRLCKADKNLNVFQDIYLCFNCWRAIDDKGKFHAEAWQNQPHEVMQYHRDMHEHYHKPLFYRDPVDQVKFQQIQDRFAKYELAKALEEREAYIALQNQGREAS